MLEMDNARDEAKPKLSPTLALLPSLLVIAILIASGIFAVVGTNLLVIRELLDHHLLLSLIGGITVAFSLQFISQKSWSLTIAIAFLLAAAFLIFSSYVLPQPVEKQSLPTLGEHPYTLIISETSAGIDPVEILSIRQQKGPFSLEWDFACLNGDDPGDALKSVAWLSPTQVRLVVGDGRVKTVTVDEMTGKPMSNVAYGYGC